VQHATTTQHRHRLIAAIDETERNIDRDSWYLMCAVTVDLESGTRLTMMRDLQSVSQRQPTSDRLHRHAIHANQMWLTEPGQRDLFEVEAIIAADPSLRLDVTVRQITARQAFEQTRQICVAHLVTHLHTDVKGVTFDTRDYLETKTRKPKPGVDITTHRELVNHYDLATIDQLKTDGRVKADLDIVWANDFGNPHLWIPDVVAYACGQTLASGNPQRLVRLASRLHVSEAVTRPDSVEPAPSTGIANVLEALRQQALPLR